MVFAHAHVFIDYKVHAVFDEDGLEGVFINWSFDRMFSAFIKNEFDTDNTNELNEEQQRKVKEGAFHNLRGDLYFANILVNGEEVAIPDPEQFTARLDNNVAEYTFFFPLSLEATSETQEVEIYFYDPVIFVAYTLHDRGLSIQNKAEDQIEASMERKQRRYISRAIINFSRKWHTTEDPFDSPLCKAVPFFS